MNIDQIRENAPSRATHYYMIGDTLHYAYISRGRVYRIPCAIWIDCYAGWLKYFRHELKPLN